jgi:hypothetical protein
MLRERAQVASLALIRGPNIWIVIHRKKIMRTAAAAAVTAGGRAGCGGGGAVEITCASEPP